MAGRRQRTGGEDDAALPLASHDPRLGKTRRTIAWVAWAYRRSPPRVFLELHDGSVAPDLLAAPLLRRLGLLAAGWWAGEHRAAAAGRTELVSSGWRGVAVFAFVWCFLAAVVGIVAAYLGGFG